MKKRWAITYLHTNDLKKTKMVYSNILGLQLTDENENTLNYQIGDHQLSFEYHKHLTAKSVVFSKQKHWSGGTDYGPSFSIECDRPAFLDIVNKVIKEKLNRIFDTPQWVGYWCFPILDHMNHTIEVFCREENAWIHHI